MSYSSKYYIDNSDLKKACHRAMDALGVELRTLMDELLPVYMAATKRKGIWPFRKTVPLFRDIAEAEDSMRRAFGRHDFIEKDFEAWCEKEERRGEIVGLIYYINRQAEYLDTANKSKYVVELDSIMYYRIKNWL